MTIEAARISWQRYAAFIALAAIGCAADLITKGWVFGWSAVNPPGRVHWIWEPFVGLQLSLNEGALFGFGAGQVVVFIILSVVAVIAIPIWLFPLRAGLESRCLVAMGLVTGGILGNLYDRLGFHGLRWAAPDDRVGQPVYAVRDWILFQWNAEWRWPNFNIADSLLVCGAALLCYHAFMQPEAETNKAANCST